MAVQIKDDEKVEDDEVLFPTLSIPPDELGVDIERNFSIVTIRDNDSKISPTC